MIRVTYRYSFTELQEEFEVIYLKNGYLKTNTFASYDINTVVKIEKQVKDLTLEEVDKLMLNSRVQDAKIIISIWDYGYDEEGNYYHDWKDLSDDDYIDITEMVKRGI